MSFSITKAKLGQMSVVFVAYLPTFSKQSLEVASGRLRMVGISYRFSDIEELTRSAGLVPLEITLSNFAAKAEDLSNKSKNQKAFDFESSFSLDLESFHWAKSEHEKRVQAENSRQLLEAAKFKITISPTIGQPASLAIAACFAAALAECTGGIVLNDKLEVDDDLQSVAAVTQSDFVEELIHFQQTVEQPRIITKANLRELAKKLAKMHNLERFIALNDLLVLRPVDDGLLRCISLDRSIHSSVHLTATAVYLPLYCNINAFDLTYSRTIMTSKQVGKDTTADWTPTQIGELAKAIEDQGLSYLGKAPSASIFAVQTTDLVAPGATNREEVSIFSHARAGEISKAKMKLNLLIAKYWLQETIFRSCYKGLASVSGLRAALDASPIALNEFLDLQIKHALEVLDLHGIAALIDLDSRAR